MRESGAAERRSSGALRDGYKAIEARSVSFPRFIEWNQPEISGRKKPTTMGGRCASASAASFGSSKAEQPFLINPASWNIDGHQLMTSNAGRLLSCRDCINDPRREPAKLQQLRHLFPASPFPLRALVEREIGRRRYERARITHIRQKLHQAGVCYIAVRICGFFKQLGFAKQLAGRQKQGSDAAHPPLG